MKMTKKVLSLILAMSMLLGTVTFAATYKDVAQTTKYYQSVSLLSALEIIKGYEDGTFGPDKNVTRAEFSVMLVRTLGLSGVGNTDPAGLTFKDLGTVAWAVSDIRTAYDLGIINGMSAEEFAPDSQVTYEQAIKMIVCALGYKVAALDRVGGDENLVYPDGYLAVATQNDIDLGVAVKKGQPAKRWEIAKLLYNSLEIDLMEKVLVSGSDQYKIRKGKTILSEKLRIKSGTGELKADEKTSVSTSGQLAKTGEVAIYQQDTLTEETYIKGTIVTTGIVGHSIKYYYREDNNGVKTLAYLEDKTNSSSVLKIDAGNIDSVDGTIATGVTIKYWVNKDTDRNTTSVTLAPESSVIINGRTSKTVSPDTDFMPLTGEIELMSTSSNGTYDKIFVTSYETYVVNTISSTDKKIFDMYKPSIDGADGKKVNEVVLDEDDSQITLKMVNSSNATISFNSLVKWNVLSVKQTYSSSKNNKDVIVTAKPITGSITELDKDNRKLKIGTTSYEFSKYFVKYYNATDFTKMAIDDSGTFYLDKDGKIAAFDKTASRSNNYGYLAGAWIDSDVLNFKFMLQNGASVSPGGINVKGASKIKLNGSAATKDAIVALAQTPQLVKYSVNGSGEIDTIVDVTSTPGDFVKGITESNMKYNSTTTQFVGPNSFKVNSATNIFIVPKDKTAYDKYAKIPYSSLRNDLVRDAIAYDLTGDSTVKTAKAVIIFGDDPRGDIVDETPIAIITGMSTASINGESVQKITAYTYGIGKTGAEETFTTETATTLSGYGIGDIIRFGTLKGYISKVEPVLDVHVASTATYIPSDKTDTPIYKFATGCVYSVDSTQTPQTFELAKTVTPAECENVDKLSFVAVAGATYLKYPNIETKELKPTKTDLMNMANEEYFTKYPNVAPADKKASQVFVYALNNVVKVIYYYTPQL